MFIHTINEDLSLKLIALHDAERVFELTNQSINYLREWLPWVDFTQNVDDTKNFIQGCLKGYADNQKDTSNHKKEKQTDDSIHLFVLTNSNKPLEKKNISM